MSRESSSEVLICYRTENQAGAQNKLNSCNFQGDIDFPLNSWFVSTFVVWFPVASTCEL